MIKYLVIIIILSIGINTSAQTTEDSQRRTYRSMFRKDSTRWVLSWRGISISSITSNYVDQDMMIDGLNYKFIRVNPNFGNVFAIREDTLEGKVWLWADKGYGFVGETLAYDFSLEVGDTFRINAPYNWIYDELATVDSVRYRNGLKHIYFNKMITYGDHWSFDDPIKDDEPFTMIEGIGSNAGINYVNCIGHMFSYLLCSYKDGVITGFQNVYHAGRCFNPVSISELNQETTPKISAYPNPVKDVLILEGQVDQVSQISLFSTDGRLISNFNPTRSNGQIKLNISGIPSGLYIARIQYKNRSSGKILVKVNE